MLIQIRERPVTVGFGVVFLAAHNLILAMLCLVTFVGASILVQ